MSVSLLNGLGAASVHELDVLGRWRHPGSVPVGACEDGGTFCLDLFGGRIGYHCLLSGISGSGKTELLKTLLLSMAVNFSPEDVNFVALECKTNNSYELSCLVKDLPHTAGTCCSFDPLPVLCSLKSLMGEKNRRMKLLERAHLTAMSAQSYRVYREAHPEAGLEPLPYLVIVIDDFAEMVTIYPELTDGIISLLRMGRVLGMHVILTMQCPYDFFRGYLRSFFGVCICMRTAHRDDSRALLGTDRAFHLFRPGQAVVHASDDDTCTEIQTFYSGTPYTAKEVMA